MFKKSYVITCLVSLLCVSVLKAQNYNAIIQGYVKSEDGHPLNSTSVYLLKATDSSVVKFTITDKNGLFSFIGIKAGSYLINASNTGYKKPKFTKVSFNAKENTDVGILILQSSTTKLNEVVISGERKFIEIAPDKIVLNIQNSALSIGNNALEVLKKAPGVQVDNDNNISLKGKSDVLVMIDNKPTYLTGSALTDLLQGTQSSSIEKIELISDPNATYDAAGTGGVINIRMVRDKSVGFNIQLTGGGGIAQIADKDNIGARANFGLNFNYRTKKLNVFGGYSYSNSPAYRTSTSNRFDSYNGKIDMINVDWFVNQRRETNNLRLGADYNIDAKQTIGFLINDVITNLTGPKSTVSAVLDNNIIDSSINTNAELKRKQINTAYNLNYKGNFNKAGELSLNADYIHYDRKYDETIQSAYTYSYNTIPYRYLTLQNHSPSNYDVYVFSGDYHLNIDPNNTFAAGIKSSEILTYNYSNFGSVAGNAYTPYSNFTGQFNYTENVNAGYVDYSHMFNKRTSIEIGARVEQTISDGITPNTGDDVKNNYFDFFPNVKISHTINDDNQLMLSYSRRITRPNYDFLNPLVQYSDQYTYQIGNQYLKPFYANKISLNHTYKDKISTDLSFEAVSGFTQTIYMQSDLTQVSILRKVNVGNRYNYVLSITAPVTFTKWYSSDFNLDARYQQFKGSSPAGNLDSGSPAITLKIQEHFKLPFSTQLDLGEMGETPTTFGVYRYKAAYYAFGAVTKSLFKKQGSVHLQVDNIFNNYKDVYTSQYQNLNLSGTQVNLSRVVTLSFTYALGSKTIKAARKRDSEAEEEQSRAAAGGN